jgi:hypothetical protein
MSFLELDLKRPIILAAGVLFAKAEVSINKTSRSFRIDFVSHH